MPPKLFFPTKIFFHSLIFLSLTSLTGQNLSGEVTYKVDPPENINQFEDTTGLNPNHKKVALSEYNKIKKTAPYLTYTLTFNSKEALFERPSSMAVDNGMDLDNAAQFIGAYGTYYMNLEEGFNLHQFEASTKFKELGNEKYWLIETEMDSIELDWDIQEETKEIQGYSCKKATARPHDTHGFGSTTIYKQTTLTAWFCPDIPVQLGPKDVFGLPGMILELEYNHYTFYPDDIKLSNKTNKKVAQPSEGKKITRAEYQKVLESAPSPPPPTPAD